MKTTSRIVLVLVCALLCQTAAMAVSHAGELAVIVHLQNPVGALNKEDVKAFFLKKRAGWQGGEKLRPVDSEAGEPARVAFLAKILGMSAADLERHWLELKYQKAESPAKKVDDDAAVIKFVAAFKGAIGFVESSALDAAAKQKVKVVFTLKY